MRKTILFLIIFVFSGAGILTSQTSEFYSETEAVEVGLSANSTSGFSFDIRFPAPKFSISKAGQSGFYNLAIPGCYSTVEIGKPNLPSWNRMIELPVGAGYEISISNIVIQDIIISEQYKGLKITPVQPMPAKSVNGPLPWRQDTMLYQTNDWFGYDFVRAGDDGILRNARIARLSLSPVEYNPVTGQLRYISSATVTIAFNPGAETSTLNLKENTSSPFLDASSYTLNGSAFSSSAGQGPVKYIILSDSMFQSTLQPLIQWKKRKGFEVIEVYKGSPGVGTTTTSMKSYLQSIYNSATTSGPAPSFLLIVGDIQQIPAFSGTTGSHPTDLYYAEFTGDIYPEMLYGRFSATSAAHLEAQINKTLHVEKYLMADPSYLQNMLLVAGNDQNFSPVWANGQMNYAQNEYVNSSNNLNPLTWLYPASTGQSAPIIQQFNQGVSFVNYSAHANSSGWSDPSFTNSAVNNLTNTGKYPLVVSNACETNTFNINSCFGETMLRASNKGAVGHIGGANLTYWDDDYHFAVGIGSIVQYPTYSQTGPGFYDRLFHTHGENYSEWAVTQGAIINAGNIAVTQSGSNLINYYWEIYCLMGDPSLMPYLGIPSPITATIPPTLPTGLTTVVMQAPPFSYVAITSNGNVHGAGIADHFGNAVIQIAPFTSPAAAEVVITGQNLIPFFDTINFVAPTGPFILADSTAFNDLLGNNNQKVDADETIQLDVRLRNYTSFNSGPLTIKLVCNSPYISMIDSVYTLPSGLTGLSTLFSTAPFSFKVAEFVPDQQKISLSIRVEDGSNVWLSPLSTIVNSAVIRIKSIIISDQPGNSNGKIEPGEHFEFLVKVENRGSADLLSLQLNLEHNSGYLQLTASGKTLPLFQGGNIYTVTFPGIALNNPIPAGSIVRITAHAFKNNYSDSLTTYKMLAPLVENFETNDFTAFQWTLNGSQSWFTTTDNPYEGATCARSGAIPDQSITSMSLTLPIISSDSISFFYKVSSELDYDFLKFFIDQNEMGRWSGEELTWKRAVFPVDSGLLTFKWSYLKDNYQKEGQDCAWIDYIVFPPTSLYSSIRQQEKNNIGLEIFPNPSNGHFNVKISSEIPEQVTIILFCSDGRITYHETFNSVDQLIRIENGMPSAGVYILYVETPSGVQTRKILRY